MAKTCSLSALAEIDPTTEVSTLPKGSQVSFLPMSAIHEGGGWNSSETRPIEDARLGYTLFKNNDVLIAKITPCFENGKAAFVDGLLSGIGLGSTEYIVLRARDGADPRFVYHWVRHPRLRRAGEASMTGSAGQRRVPAAFFDWFEVELLSPDEQRTVADILDAVDAAIRETDSLIAKLKALRLGLFGDLLGKNYPSSALGELGRPGTPFVRTGPFGTTLQGIAWQASGVPVVPIAALDGGRIVASRLDFVSPADAAKLASFVMREGDILFSRVADVGRCVVVRPEHDGWILSSNLMRMTLDPDRAVPSFIRLTLSVHHDVRRQIRANVNAGGRDVINSAILAALRVPLPPPPEQHSVVSTVEAVDARIRAHEHERAKFGAIRDGLRDDLLSSRIRILTKAAAE